MNKDKQQDIELEILYRISQAMAHQHDVAALLNEVLDILETEMGMIRGTLTLNRPDSDLFVIEASRGLTTEEQKRGQYKLGEGITGRVAKTMKSILIPDIQKDPRFLDRTKARKGARVAFLCVPIIHQRKAIGALSIDRPIQDESVLNRPVYA